MATNTTNYNLIKPSKSDNIDIDVLNNNFDVIDSRMKLNQQMAESAVTTAPSRGYISLSTTWSGNGPYTQTVTVGNATITPDSKVDLQPDSTSIAQMITDGVTAMWIENNNGTLTAYAMGAAPTASMTMQCTVSTTKTTLASIAITVEPTKTTYVAGNTMDTTGLVVTATYGDGHTANVTDACTLSIPNGTVIDTEGSKTVYVSYAYQGVEKITAFYITVGTGLQKIEVTTEPTKITYVQGDALDTSGIAITATYTDNTTADVTSNCTFSPANGSTLNDTGTHAIIVSCTENGITKTTAFGVTVTSAVLDSIAVTTNPTTTSYTVGDSLDLTGLVVTATYDGGATVDVTSGCTFSPDNGDELSTAGTQTITVAYSENDVLRMTSFDVTVSASE